MEAWIYGYGSLGFWLWSKTGGRPTLPRHRQRRGPKGAYP
ncbi:MAG: hypothetical protein ACI8QZ_004290, partial [Chlamydiales bacterium]